MFSLIIRGLCWSCGCGCAVSLTRCMVWTICTKWYNLASEESYNDMFITSANILSPSAESFSGPLIEICNLLLSSLSQSLVINLISRWILIQLVAGCRHFCWSVVFSPSGVGVKYKFSLIFSYFFHLRNVHGRRCRSFSLGIVSWNWKSQKKIIKNCLFLLSNSFS